MPTDIILYAVVAVGLILWLRSILGTRNGNERSRPNPFLAPPAPGDNGATPATPPARGDAVPGPADLQQGLARNMAIIGDQANRGLLEISRADRGFDLAHFMQGAQDAFVMIVEAYANGDRDTLRGLLTDRVFQAFSRGIDQREKIGQKANVEIHAVRRAEIIDATLNGKQAAITVRFVADETYVVRDAAGQLTQGNPDRVSEAIDVWTFIRDLRDRGPAWLVDETRDSDAADSGNLVIPDSV